MVSRWSYAFTRKSLGDVLRRSSGMKTFLRRLYDVFVLAGKYLFLIFSQKNYIRVRASTAYDQRHQFQALKQQVLISFRCNLRYICNFIFYKGSSKYGELCLQKFNSSQLIASYDRNMNCTGATSHLNAVDSGPLKVSLT